MTIIRDSPSSPVRAMCGLVSLGCAKNLVDSEVMLGLLHRAGFGLTSNMHDADVLIVNTCTFLREANQESLDTLREMALLRRNGSCRALIVTGCMVQREAEHIRKLVPEVDALIGTGDFTRITEAVDAVLEGERFRALSTETQTYDVTTPRVRTTPPWTAYVKIAEGCNHECAFCIIPKVRGQYRSRPLEDIAEECHRLVAEGVREVVFLSQDSTHYGMDLYGEPSLASLIRTCAQTDGLDWLRLLYWFPSMVEDDLLQAMADHDNVCNYVDLPLQHADREMLRAMKRPGSRASNLRLIERLRARIPEVAIRSAFIVGYPGETEEHFRCLLDFVEQCRFDHVAVFKYSAEPGTEAASLTDQVPAEVAEDRYDRLMTAQQAISLARNQRWIGRTLPVLIEETRETGQAVGRSYRDAPEVDGSVEVFGDGLEAGGFAHVEVQSAGPYKLHGAHTTLSPKQLKRFQEVRVVNERSDAIIRAVSEDASGGSGSQRTA